MEVKYKDVLTRHFADLQRRLPIEDILCSDKLMNYFGAEEIRIIKCCTTVQEKSNKFLLKLLRKPQAAFDVFMSLLLKFSPQLHSQLEEGITSSQHTLVKHDLLDFHSEGYGDESGQ